MAPTSAGRAEVREMHGSDLDGASIDADLHLATHLKAMFSDMTVQGTEKVGDHDTYLVVGRRENTSLPSSCILTNSRDSYSGWCATGKNRAGMACHADRLRRLP